MADNNKNLKERQQLEEKITFDKREQAKLDNQRLLKADAEIDKTTSLADIVEKRKKAEQALRKEIRTGARDLQKTYDDLVKRKSEGEKIDGRTLKGLKQQIDNKKEDKKLEKDKLTSQQIKTELLKESTPFIEQQAGKVKDMANSLETFVKKLPGGEFLAKSLGIDGLGDTLEKEITQDMANHILKTESATGSLNVGFKRVQLTINKVMLNARRLASTLMRLMIANPFLAIAAGAVALFGIVRKIRQANRDLAGELGISTSQAMKFRAGIALAETQFKLMGLDSTKIKTTMNEIGKEFGSLENMTARNAANIEKFAQNNSIAGTEIVKFNKVMMDLTGSSFSVATNMAETAANMAKSANVSTAKVLGDITSAAEDFARYSMSGAEGLAQAAVEAAKVGSSLSTTLKVADSLLSFEEAIGAQFKAQVLTGRQINTERARQLALDGDIAGLTQEIQSIVGGVGDLQTLNVIQRKSVAEAIGISVGELMRISRGEQVQQQVTVQDKLDITNKLLAKSNDEAGKFYATQQGTKKVEMQQPTF